MTRLEFLTAIDKSCRDAEAAFGIPQGWFKAQAIQESGGYGLSELSVKAHNLYGIKGKDYYQGVTGYASFKDWNDAIQFQGRQLSVPRYLAFKGLVQKGDFEGYGNAIQKAGYCDPKGTPYGDAIQSIAEQYDLLPKSPVSYKLNEGQQFAVDAGIITIPDTVKTQEELKAFMSVAVDVNRLCWALMKGKGKL